LIAVKRDFDVDVISTKHGLRIEHECVRVKCSKYSYYISAVYLAPDVGKPARRMTCLWKTRTQLLLDLCCDKIQDTCVGRFQFIESRVEGRGPGG
jgi:hypothetical protein